MATTTLVSFAKASDDARAYAYVGFDVIVTDDSGPLPGEDWLCEVDEVGRTCHPFRKLVEGEDRHQWPAWERGPVYRSFGRAPNNHFMTILEHFYRPEALVGRAGRIVWGTFFHTLGVPYFEDARGKRKMVRWPDLQQVADGEMDPSMTLMEYLAPKFGTPLFYWALDLIRAHEEGFSPHNLEKNVGIKPDNLSCDEVIVAFEKAKAEGIPQRDAWRTGHIDCPTMSDGARDFILEVRAWLAGNLEKFLDERISWRK